MKRNILAISVAATLGLMAGSAAATSVKANGVGMVNVIPYFSAQGNNVTQISITNTDQLNGKAVKVRFRGAEWSDDIFDFQVFMSPGDVFTAEVKNNGTNVAMLKTSDKSCTLPVASFIAANPNFPTGRLHNAATGTLEGYVEVITMADIAPLGTVVPNLTGTAADGYSLFTATKHVNGVAPCMTSGSKAEAAVTGLKQDNVVWAAAAGPDASTGQYANWLVAPTTGLTAWARVIDVTAVKAYGVPATAVDYAAPRKMYFRQANEEIPFVATATTGMDPQFTADRIFFNAALAATVPTTIVAGSQITKMYQFDMPDLSTAFEVYATAFLQRNAFALTLAKSAVASEYSTLSEVGAATDVVLNQPLRRYFYNYVADASVTPVFETTYSRTVGATKYVVTGDVGSVYQPLTMANRIPLNDLAAAILPAAAGGTPAIFYNREEQFQATSTDIVISPTPPGVAYSLSLKGEASVVSFNRGSGATTTGALGAILTMNDITVQGGFQAGWMMLSTVSKGAGSGSLPIIGFTAQNVSGAANYGSMLPLRYFGAPAGLAGAITQ